ncbi:DUF6481 family protein [Aureimonas sp. AU12]|uniref:DUF6481 family protein n=1 Tax=Aureimonas sp. AU12 TaxID=1638161 RepID=UPI0007843934|nr:DUF6481 family protein [Aureimonas sp. AU12]
MKHDNSDFAGRLTAAKDARAALMEKVNAKRNDPAVEARRAERAEMAAARAEREAAKREAAAAKALIEAQQREEEEARRQAELAEQQAAEAVRNAEENKHVTRFLQDEAALKAARDARYAARQARKG